MSTHALSVAGTGGTAALAKTQIGSDLTLPAGGPWKIFKVWGQVAKVTTVPNEGTGGSLIVESKSGDINPDPAPGTYPLIGNPANVSANDGLACNPLNLWDVDWDASGKAVVQLSYLQQLAITTASRVRAGIIFGDKIPEVRPLRFCDCVRTAFASASEQSVGTITLAEKAKKIVGILADLGKGDAVTIAEPIIGMVRLSSSDIMLPPAQYPFCRSYDAADGTPVGAASTPQAQFIPLDIDVEGGARIDIYATTDISVTGNAEVSVYLAYE